ncbi:MAG: hypothetical protein Q9207_002535 [Kuettlingeria erythrocarpa]
MARRYGPRQVFAPVQDGGPEGQDHVRTPGCLQQSKGKISLTYNDDSLELGAGSGLVGLALSLHLLRPSHIHLTDLPTIVPLLSHNIALNSPATPTTADILEWGGCAPRGFLPDILLAADCVYFEPAFPLLLQTMQELMRPETVCYFCFKKRRSADMRFVKMIRKTFDVKAVQDDPDDKVWGREGVHL